MPDRDDDRGRYRDRDDDRPRRDRDDDRPRRDRDDDDFDPRPAAAPVKSNAAGLALSIIGLVLGTAALLFSFIPCLGYLAIYPGVVAVILSGLALFVSVRGKALPGIGLGIAILSVGIAYWQGTRVDAVKTDLEKGLKQAGDDFNKAFKEGTEEWKKEMERQRLERERLLKEKFDFDKNKK